MKTKRTERCPGLCRSYDRLPPKCQRRFSSRTTRPCAKLSNDRVLSGSIRRFRIDIEPAYLVIVEKHDLHAIIGGPLLDFLKAVSTPEVSVDERQPVVFVAAVGANGIYDFCQAVHSLSVARTFFNGLAHQVKSIRRKLPSSRCLTPGD